MAEDVIHTAHRIGRIEALKIRPVLVHGPGVKGNLDRLMRFVIRGLPPMVGTNQNRRSMVGISNLVDAILLAAADPKPKSGVHSLAPIYHVCDDGVMSTRRLIEIIADGLSVRPRFIAIHRSLAVSMATMVGKRSLARRLFENLEVDDSDFGRNFAWRPRLDLESGLRLMAQYYKRRVAFGG